MKDEDIDTSDIPELGPEFFRNAVLWSEMRKPITIRLDPIVYWFFCRKGKSYQKAINAVLRKYVEAQKRRAG